MPRWLGMITLVKGKCTEKKKTKVKKIVRTWRGRQISSRWTSWTKWKFKTDCPDWASNKTGSEPEPSPWPNCTCTVYVFFSFFSLLRSEHAPISLGRSQRPKTKNPHVPHVRTDILYAFAVAYLDPMFFVQDSRNFITTWPFGKPPGGHCRWPWTAAALLFGQCNLPWNLKL